MPTPTLSTYSSSQNNELGNAYNNLSSTQQTAYQNANPNLFATAPVPAPTPTPVATPSPLVERYAPEKSNIANNPALNIPSPDANTIRESYRSMAQGTVDAIRSQFDKYITEDTAAKKQLESKAYLSSLASGLSGSPTGAAQTYNAAETGQKKVRQDIQDRETQIANAYSNADLRASQEYDQRRKEYLGSAQDKAAAEASLNANVKAEAEKELQAYAAARTYAEFAAQAGPAKIQQYMNETGLDETGLKAFFLTKTPKDELVDPNGTKLSDGSISFQKKVFDEKGNLTGIKEIARIQGTAGKTIKDSRITDNGIQILYTDGTFETKGGTNPDGTPATTPGKPITGAPKGFTEMDIEQGRNLFKQFGRNGYANPAFYVDAYQSWINKGGTAKKFLEIYPPDEFVDPSEVDLYPTYLQPKVVKKTTAVTPTTPTSSTGRSF